MDLINDVRNYLLSYHMFTDDEWLSECVNHFVDNGADINEIKNSAKEQWLLNNLTQICPGSLPANLNSLQKTCLNGRFILQINAVLDIGTPAYQQYLKLQKVNTENVDATTKFEEKVPSHRIIKLYMTDGAQPVTGIEFKPMRNLSLDITPGCKVLIKGPVQCRRGMLLLTEASIELLGGEVDEMMSNSQLFLLSTKLGLPITQETNAILPQATNTYNPTTYPQISSPINNVQVTRQDNRDDTPHIPDDDIDFNELNAIEAQSSVKRPMDDEIRNAEKRVKTNPSTSANMVDYYPDPNDFEDQDFLNEMEAKYEEMENEANCSIPPKSTKAPSSEPFVYIKQILDLSEEERIGKIFKVKGQILKLLSKLSVKKDDWTLKCTIFDGTGTLDVDFTSDVLSELVGLTPQEMYRIKKKMVNDSTVGNKLNLALQNARNKLQVLYCIIELQMLETPKITKLIPFEKVHVDLLKSRLEDSGS